MYSFTIAIACVVVAIVVFVDGFIAMLNLLLVLVRHCVFLIAVRLVLMVA